MALQSELRLEAEWVAESVLASALGSGQALGERWALGWGQRWGLVKGAEWAEESVGQWAEAKAPATVLG